MLSAGASSEAHRAALRAVNLDCQSPLVIVVEEGDTEEGEGEDELVDPSSLAAAPPAAFELFRLDSSAAAAEATRETFSALVDLPGTTLAINMQSGLSASRTSLAAAAEEEEEEEQGLGPEPGTAASSPRATSDAAPSSSWISSSVTEPREARAEAHSATTEAAVMEVLVAGVEVNWREKKLFRVGRG